MEYLIIDPSTRKIAVPKSEQLFGVYGEGNFERKYTHWMNWVVAR